MKKLKVAINEGFYWEMNKISKGGDKKKKGRVIYKGGNQILLPSMLV